MNSTPFYTEELTYANALNHIEMASSAGRYEKIILESKHNHFSIHFYRWGFASQAEINDRMLLSRKAVLGLMFGKSADYIGETFIGGINDREDSRVFLFEKNEYYVLDSDSCISLPKDKQYVFLGQHGGYNIFRIVRDTDGE